MGKMANGYYRGCLETNGFKTPFIVYASSTEHAIDKALKGVGPRLENTTIQEVKGPYHYIQM